jgi:hypothetical protein
VIERCDLRNCLDLRAGRKSRDKNASFKIERVGREETPRDETCF